MSQPHARNLYDTGDLIYYFSKKRQSLSYLGPCADSYELFLVRSSAAIKLNELICSLLFFMKISNDSCHCQFQREATLYVPFYVVSNELRGFFLFLMWKTSHSCLPSFFSLAWLLLLTLAKWFPSVHWRVLIIIANIPMTMETREKKKWIETQLFFYYSIQYDLFHHSSG